MLMLIIMFQTGTVKGENSLSGNNRALITGNPKIVRNNVCEFCCYLNSKYSMIPFSFS